MIKNPLLKLGQFFYLPAIVGLIVAVVVSFWIDSAWVSFSIIFIAAILLGLKLNSANKNNVASAEPEVDTELPENTAAVEQHVEEMEQVVKQVVDVCNRQIESSREQTEEAINVMSTRFTSLVSRLNTALEIAALSNSAVTSETGLDTTVLDSVFDNSRQELTGIVQNLSSALVERKSSFEKLQELSDDTDSLKTLAEGVEKIASQTNLLA